MIVYFYIQYAFILILLITSTAHEVRLSNIRLTGSA